MPRSKQFLLEQIARVQRFARAMSNDADRDRFEEMERGYRSELEAAQEAEDQPSSASTASGDTALAATPQLGDPDVTARATSSTDEQEPTTD